MAATDTAAIRKVRTFIEAATATKSSQAIQAASVLFELIEFGEDFEGLTGEALEARVRQLAPGSNAAELLEVVLAS